MPDKIIVGDKTLNICGIGTVSVNKYSRGSGYMKELMRLALEDMKKNGVHFSVLGGQRQRYEYFGYEPCGLQASFVVTSTNARHALKSVSFEEITFKELCFEDKSEIKKAYDLFEKKPVRGVRELSRFYDIACTWNNKLYSINNNGEYLGYISMNKSSISEIVLNDCSKLSNVITALFEKEKLESFHISLPFYEQCQLEFFSSLCENCSVNSNHCFNILDYKTVIKAYMDKKAEYSKLNDGILKIKIEDENLIISVNQNKVSVDTFSGDADICVSKLDAMRFMFSPAGGFLKSFCSINQAAKSWFPLPLYLAGLDCV